jgi:hypothetical protein
LTSPSNPPGSHILDFRKYMVRLFLSRASPLTGTIGEIISFHVFGQVIIVLNTAKAAKDLLERRGDVYVDRPEIPFSEM